MKTAVWIATALVAVGLGVWATERIRAWSENAEQVRAALARYEAGRLGRTEEVRRKVEVDAAVLDQRRREMDRLIERGHAEDDLQAGWDALDVARTTMWDALHRERRAEAHKAMIGRAAAERTVARARQRYGATYVDENERRRNAETAASHFRAAERWERLASRLEGGPDWPGILAEARNIEIE